MTQGPRQGRPGGWETIGFTAFLLCVTLVFLASTVGLQPSSALVPRVVGVPLVGLLLYRLVRDLAHRFREGDGVEDRKAAPRPDEWTAILWLLALPAVSMILGFVVGPAVYVAAWARFRAGERVALAIAAGAVTAAAIAILFVGLLGVRLPWGVFGAWVG